MDSKPYIVHRLDKETSGIMIVAKNREYAQFFTSLFRIRKIHKTYLAITQGRVNKDIKILRDELTLYENNKPYGWPDVGEPPPQGDYYCGRNIGENIMREHTDACIAAGIEICGTNAEVMLGQWEYQIGAGGSIHMSDDLWVARWLMERICEKHELSVSLHPKPIVGDWNGAGCHTNFSTREMREEGGYDKIIEACEKLSKNPQEHIDVYGQDNEQRLTGDHETCSINEFRYGVSDRGASIRIPWQVEKDKKGYLEDRRPSSNCDPYVVAQKLVETICS